MNARSRVILLQNGAATRRLSLLHCNAFVTMLPAAGAEAEPSPPAARARTAPRDQGGGTRELPYGLSRRRYSSRTNPSGPGCSESPRCAPCPGLP